MSRRNRDRRKPPAYLPAVLASADLRPGEVYTVTLRHKPRCSLARGKGPCDCNPLILPPQAVASPDDKPSSEVP
jgi:hypothetical protein